jgi:hypothetical protein
MLLSRRRTALAGDADDAASPGAAVARSALDAVLELAADDERSSSEPLADSIVRHALVVHCDHMAAALSGSCLTQRCTMLVDGRGARCLLIHR